jgi:tetratricopeptide (TPR) repeat protein
MRSPRSTDRRWTTLAAAALVATLGWPAASAADDAPGDAAAADDGATADVSDDPDASASSAAGAAIAAYYQELERLGLVDVTTGDRDTLTAELAAAEKLLQAGAAMDAAIALFAIVESPRYAGFETFVEYQNAEYELGVALTGAGATGTALEVFARAVGRGEESPYMEAAHQRMVDLALQTRDHAAVLARLERAAPSGDALPIAMAGERQFLRGRAAYDGGDLDGAERALALVPARSRMFSAATYLRGVIAARRGTYRKAAAAMCAVADGADGTSATTGDALAFVVDDRYYTIKDLARLGLGRIAHERGEYDDAYYHYFQIPDDSDRLPEALFEAAWSMYQARDLDAARDLTREFLTAFPTSPLWPEASLLAGYVELADCEFDGAQRWYDDLATRLTPIVETLDAARTDEALRAAMFDQALGWDRRKAAAAAPTPPAAVAASPDAAAPTTAVTTDPAAVLADATALLQLDPTYVRVHASLAGLDRAASDAAATVRDWRGLARQLGSDAVGAVTASATTEQLDADSAMDVARDYVALGSAVARAQRDVARGKQDGTVEREVARAEQARLAELATKVETARRRAEAAAHAAAKAIPDKAPASLRPMIQRDVDAARALADATDDLRARLAGTADALARRAIERVYVETKRVLDKARLGKIDAVIGQKRALDIEVQDLAAGRMPAELRGRLWSESQIGDDEEFWPFEGEYWADEYEGWR